MSLSVDTRANYGPQPLENLIRESLKSDNRLWVAGEVIEGPGAYHVRLNTFYIARSTPCYDIEELNRFLADILPGIERHETHDFYQPTSASDMSIGIIHYREQIGTRKTRTTRIISPDNTFSLDGVELQEGEFSEEVSEKLYRVSSLHVYPHPIAAQVALQKADLYQTTDYNHDIFVDTDLIGIQYYLTAPVIKKLKEYDRKSPKTRLLIQ